MSITEIDRRENIMVKKMIRAAAAVCAAMLVGLGLPVPVQAKNIVDNGDFKYMISDDGNTAELISYSGQSLYVSVPATVDSCSVTSVGAAAFRNNTGIKELELPQSVHSVGNCAFEGCSALKKVQIPGNVKEIGDNAFSGCSSLTEVTIDDGIVSLGRYAFADCTSLEALHLPNSLDTIGDYCFINCTSLSVPGIPMSLKYFGGYALENTKWMNSQKGEFVSVGDGILIKYLGEAKVKSLPDKIKTIGSHCFAGNHTIEQIMLPGGTNSIEVSAFEDCTVLNNIYIPASVSYIGSRAFYGCTSLQKIDLPDGLNTFEDYVFSGSGLTSIRMPASLANINKGAFSQCRELETADLGSSLKKIGEEAFKDCEKLRKIICPMSLKQIDKNAFENCTSLTRVEFNGDTLLAPSSFNECPNLYSAAFYRNPTKLEDNAFNRTPKLTIYSDNNQYLEEYAARNGKHSDTIKNLPVSDDNIELEKNDKDEGFFSSGYTFLTVIIILIDLSVVILMSIYIMFIEPKQRRRRHDKALAQAAERRRKADEKYLNSESAKHQANNADPSRRKRPVTHKNAEVQQRQGHSAAVQKRPSVSGDTRPIRRPAPGNTRTFDRPVNNRPKPRNTNPDRKPPAE